jgi:phosphoenolpyruvate phosphomutase
MKKTTKFKSMLQSGNLDFICEAHNGLSAKIVEESGFKGIWGSGLSISAAMGVRDNNEASWTQVLEVLEFMSDNTSVPILLDGDTGYGNFNNMRRLVNKLEQRGVAAVCIEDKVFPKTNSFIKGENQPLADMDEFALKITAGKDAQTDDDFCIVARTEAFIAGWGLGEALKRAECYRKAGADAILVHSKINSPSDIIAFMKEWDNRHPIVIVPTMYYSTPTQLFRELGISLVIWANHILRSSIATMQNTARHLLEKETLMEIEEKLPTVKEIFRLQGMAEYSEWEKAYLPKSFRPGKGILLAASKGSNFGDLTTDRPKAMLEVQGTPVIEKGINSLREAGVRDITIVTGYMPDAFTAGTVRYVHNENWQQNGEVGSLLAAKDSLTGPILVGYGDVVCRDWVVNNLVASHTPITVAVDYAKSERTTRKSIDYAVVTPERADGIMDQDYKLKCIGPDLSPEAANGEWIGMVRFSEEGTQILSNVLEALAADGVDVGNWSMPQLLNHIVETGSSEVTVQFIHDNWLDIDDIRDLSDMYDFYNV